MNFINVCLSLLVLVGILDLRVVNSQGHSRRHPGKMPQKIINTILKLHNEYRRSEGASNMKQLKWSRMLQRDAQMFASKCRYAHAYGKWGENVFKVESHLPDDVLVERAINEWYFEKMSWAFTPDCSEACHYTQVVWATAEEIGCSFKRCTTLFLTEEFIPNGWMLVCYYNPQGNIIGQMPYKATGNPCSACPKGYPTCNRGLCNRAPPVSRYLPQTPAKPPPKPRPTPRVYRAPPHPPAHHKRQNHRVHHYPDKHAHQPGTVVRSQSPHVYQAPPRQQRNLQQVPPKSAVYQYPPPQHKPVEQYKHQGAPAGAAVPPRVNIQQKPSAQPTSHEKLHQAQPVQQQLSRVQYISGKVLTGWMPAKTTAAPTVVYTNQTSYYPQMAAAPMAPANPHQQTVRTQPMPAGQPKQQYQYPAQQSQPAQVYKSQNAVRQAAQNAKPANMHYQSQYQTQQNPVQQRQPNNQHQYPAQRQIAQVKQSPLHQQSPTHHQQYHPRPAPVQYMQPQYAAQPATNQQRRPEHMTPAQSQQQPYRNNPQYIQNAPNAHIPQNSAPVQRPITQSQAFHQQGHPQYTQRQGQVGPNQQFEQRPQQQTNSVYVDPRPIYVPPEPVQTTTPPPPPPPPPPSCLDGDKNCKHWGVYCKSNPYVHDNCRLTCNTCSIPTPPPASMKLIQTTAMSTTTPRPSMIPSNPPSPITPVPNNNYGSTTAPFNAQTTGFNNQYGVTTAAAPYMGPGGGPSFGPCRDYDSRCKQWGKYCAIDEYVDDMCRLTCMLCHKL